MFSRKVKEVKVETRGAKIKPYNGMPLNIAPKRICHVTGVFGETGGGKSYQTKIEVVHYTRTIPGVKNGRPVLIFDTNGEYTDFPVISLDHLSDFKEPVVKRINARGWSDDEKKKGSLIGAKKFKMGLYLVDDIDKFAPFETDKEFTSLMMGGRHEGVDLMLCHQSLDMGTTIFYRNALGLRLHNQASNDSALQGKCEKHLMILNIAQHIVNTQYMLGNERFFVTINLRKKKIHGVSNKQCFINACKAYLIEDKGMVNKAITELIIRQELAYSERTSGKAYNLGFERALKGLDSMYATEPFHQ